MEKEELLTKYFLGDLTDAEEKVFDTLLKEDVEFREQFHFEKNVQQIIKSEERATLKSSLNSFEVEIQNEKQNTGFRWRPLNIAASIVLLLGLTWSLYFFAIVPNEAQLYVENYEIYPNTVFPITRNSSEDSLERNAFVAYESGQHAKAITLFEVLKKEEEIPSYIDFYLAQSYLSTDNEVKAIIVLKSVIAEALDFAPEAQWYLALAYVKKGQKEEAKLVLQDVVKAGVFKGKEAKRLLEQLE